MGVKHSRQYPYDIHDKRRESLKHQTTATSSVNTPVSVNSITIEGRQYHLADTSTYALPRDELEQDRLNSQHFSLKALYDGNILKSVERLLPPKSKILDIGCGSGSWVMEMAIDYPEHNVIGLDMSDMFPTTIRPENVKFELHNILNGLPYPDATFDFIHMRLLIIALRTTEWATVIKEIFRVLKPGGLVQLVESDFTEKTTVPEVEYFNQELINAMQEQGQDPYIGQKLEGMLKDETFEIVELNESYLDYSLPLGPISREMLTNWKNAMLSLKPLVSHRFKEGPEMYSTIIDQYIEGITLAGWKVKMYALCAQKPL